MTHHEDPASCGRFELSGGALCLDFANTRGNRADPSADLVLQYGHLVEFAREAGQLGSPEAKALNKAARGKLDAAAAALAFGLELREVLYRVFSSQAGCREVSQKDVDHINTLLAEALCHRRVKRAEAGFSWSWSEVDVNDLRSLLWPVVESAASLLTSDDLDRVRECDAKDCNWLFLDRSRGKTRRWCSMSSCGNRAKARRHYRRREGKCKPRAKDCG
jgi:predicted RNA-binding Zn ribbon-like protein